MKKLTSILSLSLALTCTFFSGSVLGQTAADSTTRTTSTEHHEDHGNWGLIGLAGLLGLAGLSKRDRPVATYSNQNSPNR